MAKIQKGSRICAGRRTGPEAGAILFDIPVLKKIIAIALIHSSREGRYGAVPDKVIKIY
jgi:hypothetical protein